MFFWPLKYSMKRLKLPKCYRLTILSNLPIMSSALGPTFDGSCSCKSFRIGHEYILVLHYLVMDPILVFSWILLTIRKIWNITRLILLYDNSFHSCLLACLLSGNKRKLIGFTTVDDLERMVEWIYFRLFDLLRIASIWCDNLGS